MLLRLFRLGVVVALTALAIETFDVTQSVNTYFQMALATLGR